MWTCPKCYRCVLDSESVCECGCARGAAIANSRFPVWLVLLPVSGAMLLLSLGALSGGCRACFSSAGIALSDAGFCEILARVVGVPVSLLAIGAILIWRLTWPSA